MRYMATVKSVASKEPRFFVSASDLHGASALTDKCGHERKYAPDL